MNLLLSHAKTVDEMLEAVAKLKQAGKTILLVEQKVRESLELPTVAMCFRPAGPSSREQERSCSTPKSSKKPSLACENLPSFPRVTSL